MNSPVIPQLPQGLRSEFDVVSYQGPEGGKTWVLVDLKSQQRYQLSPATIQGWDIPSAPGEGPSIIVTMKPTMVIMDLPTGEFYRHAPLPNRLRLTKKRRK
jgi:hypothetical protein